MYLVYSSVVVVVASAQCNVISVAVCNLCSIVVFVCMCMSIVEGSLETEAPTIWTDEKHSQEGSRARKKLARGES